MLQLREIWKKNEKFQGLKSPVFDHALKESEGVYLAQYGDFLKCDFDFNPIRFKKSEDSKLETEIVSDPLRNYVLRLKNAITNKIIAEGKLDKKLIKILTSKLKDPLYAISAEASIEYDSTFLNFNDPYLCCIENGSNDENLEKKCSLLGFESPVVSDERRLYKEKEINAFNSKVHIIEKSILICIGIIGVSIFILVGITLYLNCNGKKRKVMPDVESSQAHLNPRPLLHSNTPTNDLYAIYNLNNATNSNKFETDQNEIPPSYDEYASRKTAVEHNNVKYW